MRRMPNVFAVLLSVSLLVPIALANNVAVSNIGLTGQDEANDFALVQFDITWENSWYDTDNRDAVWVFVKFSSDKGVTWNHATLHTDGHIAPVGSAIEAPNDGKGVFIYRDTIGAGTVNFNGVRLRWNYGVDGLPDMSVVKINVFAIEMVLVPEAEFAAGSGNTGGSEFTLTTINTADATAAPSGSGSKGGQAGGFPTGQTSPADRSWPNGFSAFYCMKYEISQEQYADFLNTLTSTQAATRNPESEVNPDVDRYSISGSHSKFSASEPFVACGFLSWMDGAAYADWAGLRPMTELEYEKACRGDQMPVANEFAWGSTDFTVTTGIDNAGADNEAPSNPGANCLFISQVNLRGPMRVGCFASDSTSREQAGASLYGIMELSGNLSEQAVTISNPEGRAFTGTLGDGILSSNGHATNSDWPGFSDGEVVGATGAGLRGGSWGDPSLLGFVSDRTVAVLPGTRRSDSNGFRCVRPAP